MPQRHPGTSEPFVRGVSARARRRRSPPRCAQARPRCPIASGAVNVRSSVLATAPNPLPAERAHQVGLIRMWPFIAARRWPWCCRPGATTRSRVQPEVVVMRRPAGGGQMPRYATSCTPPPDHAGRGNGCRQRPRRRRDVCDDPVREAASTGASGHARSARMTSSCRPRSRRARATCHRRCRSA